MAQVKTNAMRILDKDKIDYEVLTYDNKDGKIDGVSVACKIGKDVKIVYKTLVTQGNSKEFYVFVIPVEAELDLKKGARASGEKKIEMIHVKDINKNTGYIRGGCSPIGMKKLYKTFIHSDAEELDNIIISGGKIGIQIELNPKELLKVVNGTFFDVIK
ncbi:Cys-tRNA(Pro) deacylase [Clostridium fallax]|uniref:Cys-tRNA(Pro)/Cys-tRNA(Cys) deacylase n=1 Tax=Clostridium fallax TaxID=1533 RepID=A0A1M4Y3R2_9CLOT|nr:Cys-tRNA(Pro) deacylase [Clostridium fallax]SHF00223.1 Cys-tRNA(Pro)/Cys-tRNA(Cys) deacylase [Clostridium fallax]SQB07800.1 ybaK/ebsC family protein [Clostridium fallax]